MWSFENWGSVSSYTRQAKQAYRLKALLRLEGLETRDNPADLFIGVDVDLVGVTGFEVGFGLVVDLDSPLESGIYVNGGIAGGANVGAGIVGGVVLGGDLEGTATSIDVHVGEGSVMAGVGTDGGVMVGGGVGPGIGISSSVTHTSTLSIQSVTDALADVVDFVIAHPPGIGAP